MFISLHYILVYVVVGLLIALSEQIACVRNNRPQTVRSTLCRWLGYPTVGVAILSVAIPCVIAWRTALAVSYQLGRAKAKLDASYERGYVDAR
jgi:choline-glycine betaine transporter